MHIQSQATVVTERTGSSERGDEYQLFQRYRGDGFKNSLDESILYVRIFGSETVKGYVDGIDRVKAMGYKVQAIVADGRRDIFNAFRDISVQLCQVCKVKIVIKYLTKKPKLEASIELRNLSLQLKNCDKV